MLGYPPKPTAFLPNEEDFNPLEWIGQPKYRGWRAVVNNDNDVFTRHKNVVPIKPSYKSTGFKVYQLDGEIINPKDQTEYAVRRAVKDGTWKLEIFDVFIPGHNFTLVDRINILRVDFDIWPILFPINKYNDMFRLRDECKAAGYEGVVLKRKDSLYKISQHVSIIDPDWIKLR